MFNIQDGQKKTKVPKGFGEILLLITAVVWGGGFVAVSKSVGELTPLYIVAIRFGIASILISIVFFKKFKEIKVKDIKYGVIVGTLVFVAFALQTAGAIYIEVGKLSFLTALNVLIVPFLGVVVFKEKIKKPYIVGAFIAMLGFWFMNFNGGEGISLGVGELLAIGCAFFFAAHIASLSYFAAKIDAIILAMIQIITCFVLGTIGAIIFEKPPTNVTIEMLLPVIYLGVFSTFMGFLCQTIAQKYTSASRAAIILCLEAVFGTILSAIFLKETMTFNMVIGAGLILTAVIGVEYVHARSEKSE